MNLLKINNIGRSLVTTKASERCVIEGKFDFWKWIIGGTGEPIVLPEVLDELATPKGLSGDTRDGYRTIERLKRGSSIKNSLHISE